MARGCCQSLWIWLTALFCETIIEMWCLSKRMITSDLTILSCWRVQNLLREYIKGVHAVKMKGTIIIKQWYVLMNTHTHHYWCLVKLISVIHTPYYETFRPSEPYLCCHGTMSLTVLFYNLNIATAAAWYIHGLRWITRIHSILWAFISAIIRPNVYFLWFLTKYLQDKCSASAALCV